MKRYSINRNWVVHSCNHCVLYCLSSNNFKLKRVPKLRETHFCAYNLERGLWNGIYIDLEIRSCSKESLTVPSFLTLHKTHKTHTTQTTKGSFPLIIKKKQEIHQKNVCHVNSNSWVCLWIDISEDFYRILLKTYLNLSMSQNIINSNKRKLFSDVTRYKTEGQNKIMFFYTVQFVSTLSKGTLTFWSQFVLYLTVFTPPLHTQYSTWTI